MAVQVRRQAGTERTARKGRRNSRAVLVGRSLTALALLPVAGRLPAYARLTVELLADARVPAARKAILAGVVGYALSPVDLIPDRIPLLGVLDDVVVAVIGLELFLAGVPEALLDEKLQAIGIPRAAFDEDRVRVRRSVPRPVRRIIKRLPAMVDAAGRVTRELAVGHRLRGWITKEGSPA